MILQTLQDCARGIGFSAFGVAPAIDEVRRRFPWAQSVICVALSYLPPQECPSDDRPRGVVARFARSLDYHLVLKEKLSGLCEAIRQECPNSVLEICVDTTPIPERKLAVLSGVGFRGWNANIYVDGSGSWVVLGEIITDLRLSPGATRVLDTCYECGECIRQCPTRAIIRPYQVDRNLCLSGVTQHRGIIALELRAKLDNRVYGCDVCQEVCPLNQGIMPATPEFAQPLFPGAYPDLIELISLNEKDFQARVRGSSIGWIGRDTIRRNAAVAAGNLRSKETLPALEKLAEEANPVLAEHALWAIGRIEAQSY